MWGLIEWLRYGKPSALGVVTGMVAGLGTITPASGVVGPAGALLIGLAAGFVCFNATYALKRVLRIDDSLDVFPVHGVGGMLGTFAAGIFAATSLGVFGGQGYADGVTMGGQLGVQLVGIGATAAWTAALTWAALRLTALLTPLRVSAEQETMGLDTTQHNERGYDLQTL
jgi:Amt family ammonium transporter